MPAGSSNSVRAVPARLATHWRFKAILSVVLCIGFCVPYFLIGNNPIRTPKSLPLSVVDRVIGFHPYPWIWIYQSVYLAINLIPWLAAGVSELRRYAKGFALLAIISFATFIAYPVKAPKPAIENPQGMYWLLQRYDVSLNSLPSLHAGLLVYTLLFGRRILGSKLTRTAAAFGILWGSLILYATLATKEHYLVDIVAGTFLAIFIDAWAWRRGNRVRLPVKDGADAAEYPTAV